MRAGRHFTRVALATLGFLAGVLFGQLIDPLWRTALIRLSTHSYQEATFKCDRAMRNHLIAKQRLALEPSVDHTHELEMAEVALIDCQDYDLLQKSLMHWGLAESDLSTMALEAIEARDGDLRQVIEIHEIRY